MDNEPAQDALFQIEGPDDDDCVLDMLARREPEHEDDALTFSREFVRQ